MNKVILAIIVSVLSLNLHSQEFYYWYQNQKIPLEYVQNKKFILTDTLDEGKLMQKININQSVKLNRTDSWNFLNYRKAVTAQKSWTYIQLREQDSSILTKSDSLIEYIGSSYLTSSGIEVTISHLFYVDVFNLSDTILLDSFSKIFNVTLIGNNKYSPRLFTLSCSKHSVGNALEVANYFHETGLFNYSVPDFMSDDAPLCVNDNHFNNQWNLENTGQHGTGSDIRFCDAQQITKGNQDIIIAVIDQGIQMNHSDLPNIHPVSFDTESGTSPSLLFGGSGHHGTPCAGIIGANSNNNLGVAGIAPDCPLMSISNSLLGTPNSRQARATGINFAWQNGASVISCSWSSSVQFPVIDNAISDALTQGRGGLGCVVVFSAGNNNVSPVVYPANINHDIIVVGAMSPCDERKNPSSCDGESWGSNFGHHLDIVAPGVFIPTTDLVGSAGMNPSGDYIMTFNGTSAAAPHVAAVAGLILSIDPTLTQKQVADIIERSAQKVGNFNYTTQSGRLNGTYHQEMGYGLLDAHKALLETICPTLHFNNMVFSSNQHFIACHINIQDVDITNSSHVIFEVSGFQNGEVNISGEFEVCVGCELEIK